MKQIKQAIVAALKKCGYKSSIEDLMLLAEFKSAAGDRLAYSAIVPAYQGDEEEFVAQLEQFCNNKSCTWGKIWLVDNTFFIFGEKEGDWQHIDCRTPEDLDPYGEFLS